MSKSLIWRDLEMVVSRTQARACDAVPMVEGGRHKSACRSMLQAAQWCCVPKRHGAERLGKSYP